MPLARGPQCCCGGPGFLRVDAGHLFFNAAHDCADGKLKRWPCWFHPFVLDASFNPYIGDRPGKGPRCRIPWGDPTYIQQWGPCIGYDYRTQQLFWSGTMRYVDAGSHWSTFGGDGLYSAKLDSCSLGFEPVDGVDFNGGWMDGQIVLDSPALSSLYESTIPTGYEFNIPTTLPGNPGGLLVAYSGVDSGRLWGMTYAWKFTEDSHLIGWSTAFDGTDYQEVFHRTKDSLHAFDLAKTVNVCSGSLYSFDLYPAGVTLYKDGSSQGHMTGASPFFICAAKRRVSDQIIICENPLTGSGGFGGAGSGLTSTGKAFIFSSGDTAASQQLSCVIVNDDEEEIELIPIGMAYDEEKDCIAIKWRYPWWIGWGTVPPPWIGGQVFCTYLNGDVSPGNLLEQDNVIFYGQFPLEDYSWGTFNGWLSSLYNSTPYPLNWGYIISGRMPDPTKVTAGHVEPPPPPPPEPPSCDPLILCEDPPNLHGGFSAFENFDSVDVSSNVYHWYMSVLNLGFELEYQYTSGGTMVFTKRYVNTGDLFNYSNPGIQFGWMDSNSGAEFDVEYYMTAIEMGVKCLDGYMRLHFLNIYFQEFSDPTGAQSPLGETYWQGLPDTDGPGLVDGCRSGIFSSDIKYQDFLTMFSGDSSHLFKLVAAIGNIE